MGTKLKLETELRTEFDADGADCADGDKEKAKAEAETDLEFLTQRRRVHREIHAFSRLGSYPCNPWLKGLGLGSEPKHRSLTDSAFSVSPQIHSRNLQHSNTFTISTAHRILIGQVRLLAKVLRMAAVSSSAAKYLRDERDRFREIQAAIGRNVPVLEMTVSPASHGKHLRKMRCL